MDEFLTTSLLAIINFVGIIAAIRIACNRNKNILTVFLCGWFSWLYVIYVFIVGPIKDKKE